MAELEKVIKGLRCLSNPYIQDMDERDCENCKYDNASCFLDVTADALSLLEAQDETRLIYHYSRPNVYADLWLHCEKCGEKVDNKWRPKYCPGCGRAVKWDG